MSDNTPRLRLGQMVDGQELDAMTINDALIQLDVLTDACFKGQFVNTPPTSPADGDTYLLGAAPSGAWSGYAYKIAYCLDGGWRFTTPFDGMRALVATSGAFILYQGGTWSAFNPSLVTAEASIASAAVCDIGAAASLCVAITGNTAITSLGNGANILRFVRFTGALILTYNATSLVTPGAANIQTAAGDCCIARSDAGGNWRIIAYQPAGGIRESAAGPITCSASGTVITALTLTPGRWRLSASLYATGGNANTYFGAAISTVSGNTSAVTVSREGNLWPLDTVNHVGGGQIIGFDVTVTSGATYYLNARYASNSDSMYGVLRAERIV